MKIWSHTLVKNEERYLWFAVQSVAKYMDKMMIWDTGSSDQTVAIIKELQNLYPNKIEFKSIGEVSIERFSEIRQKMIEETKSDWVFILDGDEVWWDDSIAKLIELIDSKGKNIDSIVNKYVNVIGDIFHYQEERAGQYKIDNVKGHITIRAMNMVIPGIHAANPHGKQAFFDETKTPVQNLNPKRRVFLEPLGYMHFTHVVRSDTREDDLKVPKRDIKLKRELGIPFPLDYYYPEVFFRPKPKIVPSPWVTMDQSFRWQSKVLTPLRKFKRRFIPNTKSGY